VSDIVDGICAAIDQGASCALYNLGNHHPEPLSKLISLLEKNLGKEAQKIYRPMQQGDVVATYADIEASTAELNFKPNVSLEEGVAKFVQWYKKYHNV
jgi:UDP-glucuronate 4-epimerase